MSEKKHLRGLVLHPYLCQLSIKNEFLDTLYRVGIDLAASYSTNFRVWNDILWCQSAVRQERAWDVILKLFPGEVWPRLRADELEQDVKLQWDSRLWKTSVNWSQARACCHCISFHLMLSSSSQPSQTCNHCCFLYLSHSFLMNPNKWWNHLGWKKPIRSLSAIINLTYRVPSLNHMP